MPQPITADLQTLKQELSGLKQQVDAEFGSLRLALSDLQAGHADLARKQSGYATANDVNRLDVRLLASEAAQSGQIDFLTKSLLNVSKPEQDLNAGIPAAGTSQGTAAAVAAVVNEWIAMNSRDRAELLTLAWEAGLSQAKLASFDTQRQEQGAVVTVSYAFRDDENGPWLWVPSPGSDSIYAAPADAAAFRMGTAPGLLADLFEGLGEVQQGFAFETIYRPCRLQKSGEGSNLYAKKDRGLLRLRGTARPRSDDPPSFAAIRHARQGGSPAANDNSHWGADLAVWVSKVSTRLDEQMNDIERLQEQATKPVPAKAAASSGQEGRPDSRMEELRSLVAALQSGQQRAEDQWRQVTTQLRALESMQSVAQQGLVPAPVDRVPNALRATPPSPFAAAPVLSQFPAQTQIPLTAQPSPAAPLPPVQASPRQVEVPSVGATPEPPARLTEDRLKRWQRAFLKAAALPQSEPLIEAMPSASLYVQRVRALRQELARTDKDADFSVVHLKREENGSLLEVHPTEITPDQPDETVCAVCKTGHTWQLAVCAGKPSGTELSILLPASTLGKSIYLPGYSVLIEEPPQLFSTAEFSRPALLRLAEGGSRYHVVQKLNVRGLDAAESGRGPR